MLDQPARCRFDFGAVMALGGNAGETEVVAQFADEAGFVFSKVGQDVLHGRSGLKQKATKGKRETLRRVRGTLDTRQSVSFRKSLLARSVAVRASLRRLLRERISAGKRPVRSSDRPLLLTHFFFRSRSSGLNFGGGLVVVSFVVAGFCPVSRLPTPFNKLPVLSPTLTPTFSAMPTPVLSNRPPSASSFK